MREFDIKDNMVFVEIGGHEEIVEFVESYGWKVIKDYGSSLYFEKEENGEMKKLRISDHKSTGSGDYAYGRSDYDVVIGELSQFYGYEALCEVDESDIDEFEDENGEFVNNTDYDALAESYGKSEFWRIEESVFEQLEEALESDFYRNIDYLVEKAKERRLYR